MSGDCLTGYVPRTDATLTAGFPEAPVGRFPEGPMPTDRTEKQDSAKGPFLALLGVV